MILSPTNRGLSPHKFKKKILSSLSIMMMGEGGAETMSILVISITLASIFIFHEEERFPASVETSRLSDKVTPLNNWSTA